MSRAAVALNSADDRGVVLAGRKTGDAIEDLRGFGHWRVLLLAFVGCVRSWQWVGGAV